MMRSAPFRPAPETWTFLAVGVAAVAWVTIDAAVLSGNGLVTLLAIAVAITGLPHGALDPWVAWRAGMWRTRGGCVAFHLGYIGLAAVVVAAWRLAPGPCLAGFLAISAWHFAGDWRQSLPAWARALAGSALLALPAWRWPSEMRELFGLLAGPEGIVIADALTLVAPWLAAGMAAAALVALHRSPATAIELAALAAMALLLPPLLYFIVYFCALHSFRHLRLAAAGVAPEARQRMVHVAMLYTALTLLAAAVAWPWLVGAGAQARVWGEDLLRVVFIGLAALSLPHMLVVLRAERQPALAP